MKARWILVLASLLAITMVAQADDKAASKSDKKSGDVTAKLESLERQTWESFKNRDVAAFQAIVDKDAYGADVNGFMQVSQVPEMMKDFELRSYTLENFRTQKIDEGAYVLTYTAKQDASYKGQALPNVPTYAATVFAKRGNKWVAVYHQETMGMTDAASAGTQQH